jgi:hypothetical protein
LKQASSSLALMLLLLPLTLTLLLTLTLRELTHPPSHAHRQRVCHPLTCRLDEIASPLSTARGASLFARRFCTPS